MNKKLNRVLNDIQKTEEKIAVWQEHLRSLNDLRKQLEEQEILKCFHSLKLEGRQMLAVLEGLQNGTIPLISAGEDTFSGITEKGETKQPETAENQQASQEGTPESEDKGHEEI